MNDKDAAKWLLAWANGTFTSVELVKEVYNAGYDKGTGATK